MKFIKIVDGKRFRTREVTLDFKLEPGDLVRCVLIDAGDNKFMQTPLEGWMLLLEISVEGKVISGNFAPDNRNGGFGNVVWPKFTKSMLVRGKHGTVSPIAALNTVAPDLLGKKVVSKPVIEVKVGSPSKPWRGGRVELQLPDHQFPLRIEIYPLEGRDDSGDKVERIVNYRIGWSSLGSVTTPVALLYAQAIRRAVKEAKKLTKQYKGRIVE